MSDLHRLIPSHPQHHRPTTNPALILLRTSTAYILRSSLHCPQHPVRRVQKMPTAPEGEAGCRRRGTAARFLGTLGSRYRCWIPWRSAPVKVAHFWRLRCCVACFTSTSACGVFTREGQAHVGRAGASRRQLLPETTFRVAALNTPCPVILHAGHTRRHKAAVSSITAHARDLCVQWRLSRH